MLESTCQNGSPAEIIRIIIIMIIIMSSSSSSSSMIIIIIIMIIIIIIINIIIIIIIIIISNSGSKTARPSPAEVVPPKPCGLVNVWAIVDHRRRVSCTPPAVIIRAWPEVATISPASPCESQVACKYRYM